MKKVFKQEPAGITDLSKEFFQEHRTQIGDIERVMMKADYQKADYEVTVFGTDGNIIMDGFACGYWGEGPRGFLWLLHQCGWDYLDMSDVVSTEATRITFANEKRHTAPDYRWRSQEHIRCEVCACFIMSQNWRRHTASQRHKRNDAARTNAIKKLSEQGIMPGSIYKL